MSEHSGLEVHGLTVNYGAIVAVRDVDLIVPAGAVVALVGPNGAGKTSTARAIGGQIRSRGSVNLGGRDITGWRAHKVATAGLAQVPQGRRLFPDLTVEENLLVGGWKRSGAARRSGLQTSYEMFPRLRERRRQRAGVLSGGEQQMLSIARALMRSPRVVLMDEPSFGLAPIMVQEMFASITAIREREVSILLVEQNAVQSFRVSDTVYVLNGGRVVYHEASHKAITELDLVSAYIK